MSAEFQGVFDPQAPAPTAQQQEKTSAPVQDDAASERGIPEVTRQKSRLTLASMIAGATFLTAGLVYSVSSAEEARPKTEVTPPSPPPSPPAPTQAAAAMEPRPAPVAAGRTPTEPRPQTLRAWDADWQRRREEAARRMAEASARAAERRRSPLIVGGDAGTAASAENPSAGPVRLGGSNGTFLASASDGEAPTARARVLANQGALVAQGTLVPGVLETAINSDLPGMLRAVVAADVSSFDGQRALIPRGSRLIGQYRSGIAIGQTRAFVVWTRLITPDGVSIALGSPGTDALGRAGVTGSVDTHFFQRFGAALLLSIVGSAGQAAANAAGDGDDITINAAGDASRVAEQALQSSVNIPPTIKVRQGTPIRIFVARDLDFSGTPVASSPHAAQTLSAGG